MENPFVFSDMVFDKDYTPEGLAWQGAYAFNSKHALKYNLGGFVLDEVANSHHDPYLAGAQLRFDSTWTKKISTSFGGSFLAMNHKSRAAANPDYLTVPDKNVGNSRDAAGNLLGNYNPIIGDGALTYTLDSFPLYTGAFPITVSGEYMNNTAMSANNVGYNVGITLGKSGKKGTWDLSYRYKNLEGDAWYEELPDSDFGAYYRNAGPISSMKQGYGSGTNVRGHVVKASYSPYDSLTLSVTAFLTELIKPVAGPLGTDSGITRLQVDMVWKF
jgi:hypothetical protein